MVGLFGIDPMALLKKNEELKAQKAAEASAGQEESKRLQAEVAANQQAQAAAKQKPVAPQGAPAQPQAQAQPQPAQGQAPETLPEFDFMRRRLEQESNKAKQEGQDALQRRFAAQGMLGSGALLKQQGIADDEANQALAQGKEGIGIQELQEKRRQKELGEARAFQTSEREATQKFAGGERESSQLYGTGERLSGQLFSKGLQDQQTAFNEKQLSMQDKWKGWDRELAQQDLAESKKANQVNALLAQLQDEDVTDGAKAMIRNRINAISGSNLGITYYR